MKELLYLNGKYMKISEGRISVEDRGFQFGDGIYDVMSVYNGRIFAMKEHIKRLQSSRKALKIKAPMTGKELAVVLQNLVSRSACKRGVIYLQLTRGAYPRRHGFPPRGLKPTFLAYIRPKKDDPKRIKHLKAITVNEERWGRPCIKSVNLLPNIMAKEEANRKGATEAIFIRRDGVVIEGSATNVYIVKKGRVITHPLENGMLGGITRAVVAKLAAQAGIMFIEKNYKKPVLMSADEVFISGTITEIAPVVMIDNRKIGTGKPGPVVLELIRRFGELTGGE